MMMQQGFTDSLHYQGPRPNPEMSQNFSLWKHQVRHALEGLCAVKPLPPAPEPAGGNASFATAMHTLYVESHFAEFVSFDAWRQAGLDETTGTTLKLLQEQLDDYDEPDTDAAILADPTWWAILGLALQLTDLLA